MSIRLEAALVLCGVCVFSGPGLRAAPAPRPRIGLALGGGSAKGFAHIGVLRWLDEHRIPVDVVSGTSIGGLIGGVFATGLNPAEIARQIKDTDWDVMFVADSPFTDKTFRRKEDKRTFPSQIEFGLKHGFRLPNGLSPGQRVELMLDELALPYYDIDSFDELPTPFRCVATDLRTAEAIVLDKGQLAQAMRATMSLPGIFTPVEYGDWLLVDGGTLNNVPADVARSMGADVVIAVDVGAETEDEKAAQPSLFTLLGKTIDTAMRAWTRKAMEAATVVIYPDLNGLTSMSWRQSETLADRGYRAAGKMADSLLPYAVSEEEYRAFVARRQARRRTTLPVPVSIEITGVPAGEQEFVRDALSGNIGKPIDPKRMARDILRIDGTDRYECLNYRIASRPSGPGLLVNVRPKSYGPPFLAFSIDATSVDSANFAVDVAGRITMYDTVGHGSEVRIDGAVGTRMRAAGEIYKPILGSRLFVAPRFVFDRMPRNLYSDDRWIGEYRVTRADGGLDLGLNAGRNAELRLGYDIADLRGRLHVGSPQLPEVEGIERFATASFAYDGQDAPVVPSRGVYMGASLRRFFSTANLVAGQELPDVLYNPQHFWQAEVTGSWFSRVHGQDRIFGILGGGTSFGEAPLINNFSLGGPFRMGAYNNDELRGANYLFGTGGYLRHLTRLPDIIGGNIYVGGWLEAGSAFQKWNTATWHTDASAGLVLETMLGPVFVGGSLRLDGRSRLYVAIGQMFR